MQALLDCVDEIALDGLDGCPILELWKHLEEKTPPFCLKLDDSAKRFLWKGIVQTKEVEFFVLDEPLAHLFDPKCDSSIEKKILNASNPLDQFQGPLKDSNEFKLVSEQGIKGSCPTYSVRKNVTQEIRCQAKYLELEAVYQRWGDCLVMVACQELREKTLLGVDIDPNVPIVDLQYCLLEHIGQARYNGRMQRTIASQYMKIDSKTVFHHLKKLRKLRLITMQQLVITTSDQSKPPLKLGVRNFTTNIVRLKRFHVQQHHKYDVLAANLCQLLLDSPNQELPLMDVLKLLSESKSMIKRVRTFLQQAGYVIESDKSGGTGDSGNNESPPEIKKKKKEPGTVTAGIKLKLVKPFVLKSASVWHPSGDEEEDDGNGEDDDDEDGIDDDNFDDGSIRDHDNDDDYNSNLVAEKPLLNQVYNVIWQTGSRGCTLKKIQRLCRLPFFDVRLFVKKLKSKNLVQEVFEDIAKIRVVWFVATPFVESNTQTVKVKQVQDQLKHIETRALDQTQDQQGLISKEIWQPSPSGHPPATAIDLLDVKERKPLKGKSLLGERVTYRKLKRRQMVLEYMQSTRVVEGAFPIQKAVMAGEQEEGLEGKIDRKGLLRILDDLISEGLMRQLKTLVNHGTASQVVELYLHPSVSNGDSAVLKALEQCRARLRDESFRMSEREEKARQNEDRKREQQLRAAKVAEEKEKKKAEKEEREVQKKTAQKREKVPSFKYGFLPRYPRIQILHELIWKLVYGNDTNQKMSSTVENNQVEGNFSENDECLKNLKPMEKVLDEYGQPLQGWFRFCDVFSVMPLMVICKTVDITDEIEGFDEYVLDPVMKYTLLCDLPLPLRSRITEHRKVKSAPLDLLVVMAQMGLITPSLPFPVSHRDIKLFLNKGVKLLDTSVSQPGWYTARPPDGTTSFAVRTHMFTSMAAVRNYWSDLKCVCLNTPLGVARNLEEKDIEGRRNTKLLSLAKKEVDENRVDLPPGDQLGAGGLDRRLFAYLPKNWARLVTSLALQKSVQEKERTSLPVPSVIPVTKTGGDTANKSGSVHSPDQGKKKSFLSLGRAEMKKKAKQQKKKVSRKRKAEDAQKSEGVKRIRTNKAKTSEKKKDRNTHVTAVDEEDKNILARKTCERIQFSAEEDSWLLLFHIALGIMKKESTGFGPSVYMRNILHKQCAASFDKTAPNIHRRILKLMKYPQSQMTVKVCSVECAHDKSFQGFDDPNADFEKTFKEVVKRLRQKFSTSSLSWDGDGTLVASIKELHDKYKVKPLVSKDEWLSTSSVITTVSDINKAALRDQIQIALTTPREIYDAYRVFQMFNSFTKEELTDVFKEMQKNNLVRRRKTIEDPQSSSQFSRSLPFASMTYQLSPLYHRLFLQAFKLVTLHKDCAKFWTRIVKGEQQLLQPSNTATDSSPGSLEVNSKNTCGGDVACFLSLLATNKVYVEMNIPDTILNMDASGCNTNVQQQANEDTVEVPAEETNRENGDVSLQKRNNTDTCQVTKQNKPCADHVSPSTVTSPQSGETGETGESGRTSQSTSSVINKGPDSVTQSYVITKSPERTDSGPSTPLKERPDKRKLLTLSVPSSTVATFTSPYDVASAKESGDFLKSCPETSDVEPNTSDVRKVTTVPVASLTYNSFTSRSSRTALMLARGGKDPYVSINQLPARPFNTHDFMTLYHIKNVVRLKHDKDGNLQNEADAERITSPNKEPGRGVIVTSSKGTGLSQDTVNDAVTSPVIVTESESIKEYLYRMKTEMVFNEVDATLSRDIHHLVDERREFGFPVVQLEEKFHKSHEQDLKSSQYSLDEHVQFLCAAKQMYKVGFYEICLVTSSFVKPWCVTLLKPKSTSKEAPSVIDVESSNSNNEEAGDITSYQGKTEVIGQDNNGLEITGIITKDANTCERDQPPANPQLSTECSASPSTESKGAAGDNDDNTKDENETTSLSFDPVAGLLSKQTETSGMQKKKSKDRLVAATIQRKDTAAQTSAVTIFAEHGVMMMNEPNRDGNFERYSVVCRPWITIDGTSSKHLLRMFREMVLMLILDNPGIPEGQIAKHVFEALRPAALQDILQVIQSSHPTQQDISLLQDGCIIKHLKKAPPKMSLFSSSKLQGPTTTMVYYTPTVDCIFNLATSRRTGYT